MRILLLVTDLGLGGAPLVTCTLARGLRELGCDVHVACLGSDGPMAEPLRRAGIPVTPLGAMHRFDVVALARLHRLVRGFRPHVLQSLLFHANVAGSLVAALGRVPVHVAEICTTERDRRWHVTLERAVHRRYSAIVCPSDAVRSFLLRRRFDRSLLAHIPHDVPTPADRPLLDGAAALAALQATSGPRVLFVGRLDPAKGLRTLLDAWPAVRDAAPTATLCIAGDGPDRALLSPSRDGVAWVGAVGDPTTLHRHVDLFAAPSRVEGFGLAVAEAMRSGLCCVASDVAALRELIRHDHNGVLLPADDAQRWAAAIIELLRDDTRRRTLGAQAALRDHGDGLEMARAHLRLYRSLP